MATPAEKLADALDALHPLQNNGMVAINTNDISTVYRQRLTKNGFLKAVLKGQYSENLIIFVVFCNSRAGLFDNA